MSVFKRLMVLTLIVTFGLAFNIGISKAEEPEVIKIGAILPLTGPAAFYGEWGMKGMNLAIEEINSSGGINGKKLQLVYGDSKNAPKEGVTWMNKFDMEKLPIVISGMTGVSFSVLPIAERSNTVLFMTIITHPDAANRSPWAFRHYVNKGKAAQKMAIFARNILKIKKVAILHINDEGGLGEKNAFLEKFEAQGGQIVHIESFEKTETNPHDPSGHHEA